MGRVTTQALALRRTPFGETSQIAEFLTRSEGRISLIIKGVHRERSRKGGSVDLLDECVVTYWSRRNSRAMPQLSERRVTSHHPGMRRRRDLLLAGQYLVELLRSVVPEGQRVPGVFELSSAYLAALDGGPEPAALPTVVFALEGAMLRMAGFEPVLDRCVACGRRPQGHRVVRCDPQQGGIVCSACRDGERGTFDLSSVAAETILRLAGQDPRRMTQTILPPDTARDVRRFFDRTFVHLLERRPRCLLLPFEFNAAESRGAREPART